MFSMVIIMITLVDYGDMITLVDYGLNDDDHDKVG